MVQGEPGELGALLILLGLGLVTLGALLLALCPGSRETRSFGGVIILGPVVVPLGSWASQRRLWILASLILLVVYIIILLYLVKR